MDSIHNLVSTIFPGCSVWIGRAGSARATVSGIVETLLFGEKIYVETQVIRIPSPPVNIDIIGLEIWVNSYDKDFEHQRETLQCRGVLLDRSPQAQSRHMSIIPMSQSFNQNLSKGKLGDRLLLYFILAFVAFFWIVFMGMSLFIFYGKGNEKVSGMIGLIGSIAIPVGWYIGRQIHNSRIKHQAQKAQHLYDMGVPQNALNDFEFDVDRIDPLSVTFITNCLSLHHNFPGRDLAFSWRDHSIYCYVRKIRLTEPSDMRLIKQIATELSKISSY